MEIILLNCFLVGSILYLIWYGKLVLKTKIKELECSIKAMEQKYKELRNLFGNNEVLCITNAGKDNQKSSTLKPIKENGNSDS